MVTHCFSSFSIPCKHLSNSFFSPNHVRTILIWQVMHHEIEQNSSCMAINSLGIFWNCKVCNLGSPMGLQGSHDPMRWWCNPDQQQKQSIWRFGLWVCVCGGFGLIIMILACVLIRKKAQEVIHQSKPNFMKLKAQESSKTSGLFAVQEKWRKSDIGLHVKLLSLACKEAFKVFYVS